ncbi:myelin regulatory factor-like protein isoform X4 [Folsomia candida]|uniref:myelin regulatory factor-like protein isoform X4 n=1 Tax=Folsomia candida TaxID=158441 RepID=UPI0016052AA4|nr:myelin regulatory factor-like protein isoform X4 [Folsomia candida]
MDQGYHLYKDYTGNLYPQNRGNHNNVHPNQGIPHHHLHHQHAQQQHHHQQQHQPHVSVHLKHPVPAAREDFAGLDNDALDFSQLEDFIANEADGSYFADTLANSEASKHTQNGQAHRDRIIVVTNLPSSEAGALPFTSSKVACPNDPPGCLTAYANGQLPRHNLPDSPPDSGSEPPYSPTDPGSRSPNHKDPAMNGRRNLHELLLHPMFPQSSSGGSGNGAVSVILQHHDLQSLGSPISSIPSITHTGTSPSANNVTLTTLGGSGPCSSTQVVDGSQTASPQQDIPFYTNLTPVVQPSSETSSKGRKRKASESGASSTKGKVSMVHVKQEPALSEMSPGAESTTSTTHNASGTGNDNGGSLDDDFYDLSNDPSIFMDPNYQCIKFQPFHEHTWLPLADEALKELPTAYFKVDADKGFNFSNADDAFVCQKKNHFQITCHAKYHGNAKYVKTADGFKPVDGFCIHFYGVKAESPNHSIKIEQSQSDRSKKPFHPVPLDVNSETVSKLTVGRLHFNETTSNNMRKKGKPNPDQRYFYLVVALHAHGPDGNYPLLAHSSQRIIVRVWRTQASNPGQFESDMELSWQKGQTSDSIYHAGRVGINMDRPEEALVVYGNCKVTGQIIHPSDMRAKENIVEMDSKQQLKNVQQLRVVRYKYNPEFARLIGISDADAEDTGVIAQEVQKIIPEAVKESGDIKLPDGNKISNFLVVNKERIFMENIGAVKELCKVTGKLETRIDHLEKITNANRDRNNLKSGRSSSRSSASSSLGRRESATKTATEYICSNRCVQILIVILVLIMAFCLVAMATLYWLEYHKRSSYDFHHHNSHHIFNSSREFLNIPASDYRHGSYGAPSTFYPAPIHPHSFNSNHPTKNPKSSAKSHHSIPPKTGGGIEPFLLMKPKVLGRPQYCFTTLPYLDTQCGTFCCAGASLSPTDYSDIERRNQVVLSVSSTKLSPPPVTLTPQNNNSEDAISNFSSNPVHRNGLDSKRRRRQIDENPLITVPSIRVLSQNINQTLDASYCMLNSNGYDSGYHDCVSTDNRYFSSANLTYHVPLSKYWDEMNVKLIFKFSPRVNISQPQMCQEFYDQPFCRLDDATTSTPNVEEKSNNNDTQTVAGEGKNVFSLSVKVGGSPYSRFNIKFSSNVDTQDLCNVQKNIFEFNFHFYRVCHE